MKLAVLLEQTLKQRVLAIQQRIIDEIDPDAEFEFRHSEGSDVNSAYTSIIVTLSIYDEPVRVTYMVSEGSADQWDYFKKQVRDANPKLKANKIGSLNYRLNLAWPNHIVQDPMTGHKTLKTGYFVYKTEAERKAGRGESWLQRKAKCMHVDVETEGSGKTAVHGYLIISPDNKMHRVKTAAEVVEWLTPWCGQPQKAYFDKYPK